MNYIEIIGLVGAIASIIGLLLFLFKKNKKMISQSGSSFIKGRKNKVEIKNNRIINTPSRYLDNSNINQNNSSIIYGSDNVVSININPDIVYDPLITITKSYRHLKEFSFSSFGGVYEIQELFIEIEKFHICELAPVRLEELMFRTYYDIFLDTKIKYYPLLPSTLNNNQDGWVLKGDDIELFGVNFSWPRLTSVGLVIKAKLLNHKTKKVQYIKSKNISLERNGEKPTNKIITPPNTILQISPYLLKLITIPSFQERLTLKQKELNAQAIKEIDSYKNIPKEYKKRLKDIKEKIKGFV